MMQLNSARITRQEEKLSKRKFSVEMDFEMNLDGKTVVLANYSVT